MVSLMRSRRSSPVLTGLLGGLAPFFLARDSSSASASTSRARGPRLAICSGRRGASPALAFSGVARLRPPRRPAPSGVRLDLGLGWRLLDGGRRRLLLGLGLGTQRLETSALGLLRLGALTLELQRRGDARRARWWKGRRVAAIPRRLIRLASVSTSAPAAGAEIVRFFFFSTTTDFDRPWLKLCLTWPASTVRFRLSGLRAQRRAASSRWLPSFRSCTSCVGSSPGTQATVAAAPPRR